MSNTFSVITGEGKYKTVNNHGILSVYRNNELEVWREKDLIGDKYVMSLVDHIEDLEMKLETYASKQDIADLFNKVAKERAKYEDVLNCSVSAEQRQFALVHLGGMKTALEELLKK